MKKFFALISAICTASALFAAEAPAANDTVIDLQDKMTITKIKLAKPAAEAGKIPVLQMTMFFCNTRPSGWSNAVMLMANNRIINEKNAGGKHRLLRNKAGFELNGKLIPYFKKNNWLTIYSNDGTVSDKRLLSGGANKAAVYNFDLSSLVADDAKEVELTVRCLLTLQQTKKNLPLIVRNPKIVLMTAEEVAGMRGE